MGGLAIVRVNYVTWVKFSAKFLAVIFITTCIGLIVGVLF
ncbi:MAG: hypothetical protein ACRCWN_01125 [Fusobacteriaceae bacterium]